MKRKMADGRQKENFLEREFKYVNVKENGVNRNISLLKINKVKNKWSVRRKNNKEDCILDSGYKFIQIFEEGKKYAITTIYNQNDEIVEWYIDMIKDTGIEDNMPYIDDLYLDIVITPNLEVEILDEDELEEALKSRDISEDEYNLVRRTEKEVLDMIKDKKYLEWLKEYSDKYLEILSKKVKKI